MTRDLSGLHNPQCTPQRSGSTVHFSSLWFDVRATCQIEAVLQKGKSMFTPLRLFEFIATHRSELIQSASRCSSQLIVDLADANDVGLKPQQIRKHMKTAALNSLIVFDFMFDVVWACSLTAQGREAQLPILERVENVETLRVPHDIWCHIGGSHSDADWQVCYISHSVVSSANFQYLTASRHNRHPTQGSRGGTDWLISPFARPWLAHWLSAEIRFIFARSNYSILFWKRQEKETCLYPKVLPR